MKYTTHTKAILADQYTPVGLYAQLRDDYPKSILLECSDYQRRDQSFSIIGLNPLTSLEITNSPSTGARFEPTAFHSKLAEYKLQHEVSGCPEKLKAFCGVYGFTSFEGVSMMEELDYPAEHFPDEDTPLLRYHFYRFLLVLDHFHDVLHIMEFVPENSEPKMEELMTKLHAKAIQSFSFETKGEVKSNMDNQHFLDMVKKAKLHCERGDVFQVVISRAYEQGYKGDEFRVYRALRTVNPSPYLFFFDMGDMVIMGSSPEAHLIVSNKKAEIHPIAGTYPRSGDDIKDAEVAQELSRDPKEQAEHTMLVDLARNDLNRFCKNVNVVKWQEVQFFSHVIHLVSKVVGELRESNETEELFAGSFPAGTLSGAPKHRALGIIRNLEPEARGVYGGAIGMFGLFGDCQHAIVIRSILAKNQTLRFQAGAGVVLDSDPQKEMEEVLHKLNALSVAIEKSNGHEDLSY